MANTSEIKSLTDLKVGQKAKVVGFEPGASMYRQKLLAMGLTPGVVLDILRVAPLGDPMEVRLRGYSLSLRKKECNLVAVEVITHD